MSADIIAFPIKHEYLDDTFNKRTVFPDDWPYKVNGIPVNPPRTGKEYLELCKEFLNPDNYTAILVGIMDEEGYDGLEPQLQKLVDNYFDYIRKYNQ